MPDHLRKAALSVAQFCDAVGVGRTTAYQNIKAGRIRIVKVGARTLIPASEVQAFLDCMANGGQRD